MAFTKLIVKICDAFIVAYIETNEKNINSTVINKHFRSRKNMSDWLFDNRLVDHNDRIDPKVN